jgi:hypothetical protein
MTRLLVVFLFVSCAGELFGGALSGEERINQGVPGRPLPNSPGSPSTDCSSTAAVVLPATLRLHAVAELRTSFASFAQSPLADFESPPDFPAVDGLRNDQSKLTVTPAYLSSVSENAKKLAARLVTKSPFNSGSCTAQVPVECVEQVLVPLARRVWRRPPTASEKTWLEQAVRRLPDQASSQERVQAAIRMVAMSPQALFRFEWNPDPQNASLDAWGKADFISYALTGAPPDDALATAAETGSLHDGLALRKQLNRLVDVPESRARFARLLEDVFDIHLGEMVARDPKLFPAFSKQVVAEAEASFAAFAGRLLSPGGRTFDEMFTLHRFEGADVERVGVFTHPVFLMTHATEKDSRPIHRARAVVERALCEHFGDPPAEAALARPPDDANLTFRQRFEAMTSVPQCSGCHRKLNPVGFALEGYDAVGAPRTSFEGRPLDLSGSVHLDSDALVPFDGPASLMRAVADSNAAKQCFVTRLYRHSIGRVDEEPERCVKQRVVETLAATRNVRESMVELLARLVEAPRRLR